VRRARSSADDQKAIVQVVASALDPFVAAAWLPYGVDGEHVQDPSFCIWAKTARDQDSHVGHAVEAR